MKAEPGLARDSVRHLNWMEERVLEEFGWSTESPIWLTLSRRADGVPSSESVLSQYGEFSFELFDNKEEDETSLEKPYHILSSHSRGDLTIFDREFIEWMLKLPSVLDDQIMFLVDLNYRYLRMKK